MSTTSTKDKLAEAMRELDIKVEYQFIDEVITDGWENREYRFALYVGIDSHTGVGLILSNAPYRAGMALDEPTEVDIFGSVLADASSVEPYEDWLDWAEDLDGLRNAESARKSRDDFHEMKAHGTLIRERVGEEDFQRLLEIAVDL